MTKQLAFSDLITGIGGFAQAAPNPQVVQNINLVCRDICEQTHIWRYDQRDILVVPNAAEYEFEPPDGAEVIGIVNAVMNKSRPLSVAPYSDALLSINTRSEDATGSPSMISQLREGTFIVVPTPDDEKEYKINMEVVLRPTRHAESMPEELVNTMEQAIISGVLSRLLANNTESWGSLSASRDNKVEYSRQIALLKAQANFGLARGALNIQPRNIL
jgi:hypothetical protein